MTSSIASLHLALFLALLLSSSLLHVAEQQSLSLPPRWSCSPDLTFPSENPPSLNSYVPQLAPFSLFVPCVSSSTFISGSKGFSFGFLSLFQTSSSMPSYIMLSIGLGVSRINGTNSSAFLLPIWTLNYTSPLQLIVTLEVDDNKRLSLVDGDGRVVWAVSNVDSMEMQSNGNLVILDSRNESIWESFDHPSDSLVQGQRLKLGMELTSSNNMYKARMEAGGVLLYKVSANYPALLSSYWVYVANKTIGLYLSDLEKVFALDKNAAINLTAAIVSPSCASSSLAYSVLDGMNFDIYDVCANNNSGERFSSTSDLVRLDPDGILRDYYLQQLANSSYAVTSTNSDYEPCFTPNACGAYGVCSSSNEFGPAVIQRCRCPSEEDNKNFSKAFTTIDISNPSQGCKRTVSLDCEKVSSQSLVEIENVAYMSMLPLFEVTGKENTKSLEDCKAACSSNCSCSGFFYHINSSFCLPFGESTPLSNVSFLNLGSNQHIAYVKIQMAAKGSKSLHPIIIALAVVIPAVIVIVLVVSAVYWKRKNKMDPGSKLAEEELMGVLPMLPTRYTYQELRKFTQGFSIRLGSGGFGSVYAGMLPDGRRVAVKNLELLSQGQKEFLAEIATIGGISHVNIVNLYGFCSEKQHRLLVYEYMENGSLDKWLFCKEGEEQVHVMSWETRFNVALGTARGLAYLHEECPKPILHFDVKPQNILLDGNLDAKLADFGLAKLVAREQSSVMTVVRGTPGYIAPEWVSRSIVSKKCDVYSFGMVLLELVSGRKNVEMELKGISDDWYFPTWAAKKTKEGDVGDIMDKRLLKTSIEDLSKKESDDLDKDGVEEQVKIVVGVALWCIHEDPEMRPSMTVVCGMLEGSIALPKDIPAIASAEVPAYRMTSSGSIEVGQYSSIQGR